MAESHGGRLIQILLKGLAFNHGAVSVHDDEVRRTVLFHNLPQLLFTNMKVFRSLTNREQISFPVRDLEDLASLALLIMICHGVL